MDPTLVTIAIFLVFIVWLQSGEFLPPLVQAGNPRRDWIEVSVIVLLLVAAPFLSFNVLWFTGWVSPYLIVCLLTPPILEGLRRRRSLELMGFRRPDDVQALWMVGALLLLFMFSRVLGPIIAGGLAAFEWRRFLTVSLLLPFVEEVLFRGMIQTRLQAVIKSAVLPSVLSGTFFGLYHGYVQYIVPGKPLGMTEILQVAYLICLGILLGLIFRRTRSLLPSFLVHVLNNFSL
jgi:membrane protease YdiL (CAAX protease family)